MAPDRCQKSFMLSAQKEPLIKYSTKKSLFPLTIRLRRRSFLESPTQWSVFYSKERERFDFITVGFAPVIVIINIVNYLTYDLALLTYLC